MKTIRVLVLSMLILAAGFLQAKDTIDFKFEPLRKGTLVQLSLQSDLRLYTAKANASARLMAELFVLEVEGDAVTEVKLAYGDCSSDGTIAGFASDKSPVEGKVYVVERKGGKVTIQTVTGDEAPATEKAIVERDLEYLGRPHPIAMMLNGQRLKIGDKLGQKDVLRQVLEERLQPYKIGKVKEVDAALIALSEYNKEKTAVFAFRVETGESAVAYDSKFELNGQLVVAIPTGRPIAIRLDGPVSAQVKEDSPREDLRGKTIRGSFSLAVLSQTFPGEMERHRHTRDADWIIHRPVRPRPEPRR